MTLTVALAGNPNVGKSTIFNALTGARQHTGNWPGKTVERKEGRARITEHDVVVVDLPGTYSLTAYSVEETIARDFLLDGGLSAVVAVADASNLERNLYLVAQLVEMELPVIVVLNMADLAASRGLTIDTAALSERLGGSPVVEMVGSRRVGVDALEAAIVKAAGHGPAKHTIRYDPLIEQAIEEVTAQTGSRWLAVKLLEGDEGVRERLTDKPAALLAAQAAAQRITEQMAEDADILIADQRYGFIGEVVEAVLTRPETTPETLTDRIDRIVTHRVWGLPIFFALMWLVFQVTANVSAPLLDYVDWLINGPVTRWVGGVLGAVGLGETWVSALLLDGILAGVGGVLVFVPVLLFLYFVIGVLEDSGYMARAAFVMDRVMRAIGLHGKSFLPMIVGFGCNVPAVYATRTLENEDDRKLTAFLVPFMSCGARLPVYVLFGAAFFGAASGALIFGMYVLGIAVAILSGLLMNNTVFRNKPPQPFVMELPPYRLPTLKDVARQMWERTSEFLKDASTIIVLMAVVVWALLAVPVRGGQFNDVAPEDSLFAVVSEAASPIFAPAGFGDWEATGSLVTGLVAKEVIIGSMAQIYVAPDAAEEAGAVPFTEDLLAVVREFGAAMLLTVQEVINIAPRTLNAIPGVSIGEVSWLPAGAEESTTALEGQLRQHFTPLSALAFTVFVLLYVPCMATVAAIRQEFGGRWALFQVAYTLVAAWVGAVLVYQIGSLIGLG